MFCPSSSRRVAKLQTGSLRGKQRGSVGTGSSNPRLGCGVVKRALDSGILRYERRDNT